MKWNPRVPSFFAALICRNERAFVELSPLTPSVAMALVDGGHVDEGDAFAGDECVVPKLFTLMLDSARCAHRPRNDTATLPVGMRSPPHGSIPRAPR